MYGVLLSSQPIPSTPKADISDKETHINLKTTSLLPPSLSASSVPSVVNLKKIVSCRKENYPPATCFSLRACL